MFWPRKTPKIEAQRGGVDSSASNGARPGVAAPLEYEISAGFLSDPGCHRPVNEDCWRCFLLDDPEALSGKGALAIVADGMGGHSAGELASHLAVEITSRVYFDSRRKTQAALQEALLTANRAIYNAARENPEWAGMGTTCTALLVRQGEAFLAHVGDSRLYLARDGEIYRMSEDHSAVREMVRRGALDASEARHHADRNLILRALGTQPEVAVEVWEQPFPIRVGDQFALCSDGLSDLVEDEEIKRAVISAAPDLACRELVALAKERGGYDNITVGVLSIHPAGRVAQIAGDLARETHLQEALG